MSSRLHVDGLASPHPIAPMLPSIFAGNAFLDGFLGALDEVAAPAMSVLDNLAAYVDPQLAPDDFVSWIASWLGVELDERWSSDRRRAVLRDYVELLATRGTPRSLVHQLELELDATVALDEPGGTVVSISAGTDAPGRGDAMVRITIAVDDPATVDVASVRTVVRRSLPAHLGLAITVVERPT